MAMLKAVMQATAGIRRPGAAALDLAYVAAGRLDAFWELGLSPWDTAAGTLLITEAGGMVGTLTGGGIQAAGRHRRRHAEGLCTAAGAAGAARSAGPADVNLRVELRNRSAAAAPRF